MPVEANVSAKGRQVVSYRWMQPRAGSCRQSSAFRPAPVPSAVRRPGAQRAKRPARNERPCRRLRCHALSTAGTFALRPRTISALRAALEAAGVAFIDENGRGSGGRLSRSVGEGG